MIVSNPKLIVSLLLLLLIQERGSIFLIKALKAQQAAFSALYVNVFPFGGEALQNLLCHMVIHLRRSTRFGERLMILLTTDLQRRRRRR